MSDFLVTGAGCPRLLNDYIPLDAFDKTQACDKHRDGQTDRHIAIAYRLTALA